MKFKVGDFFKVIENGLKGRVIGTSFNSIQQQDEYVVFWEHGRNEETYPVDECDLAWELDQHPSSNIMHVTMKMKLPQAIDFIPITFNLDDIQVSMGCDHKWVEVGFHFTKIVCKHCDMEQSK